MEEDLAALARRVARALEDSGSCLSAGLAGPDRDIWVQVTREPGCLWYACNLGLAKPDRPQALAMLDALLDHARRLAAASPDHARQVAGCKVGARLFVDSGPMDFRVAEKLDGQVTWLYPLD